MELTASRLLLAALPVLAVCLVGGVLQASDAQRIVSFPSATGYETTRKDRMRGNFPRGEELLQALDFLEEYERSKENDWSKDQDLLANDVGGRNDFNLLEDNDVYPEDSSLNFRQQPYQYPGNDPAEDNSVDIPAWLADYLLQEAHGKPDSYPEEDKLGEFPWSPNDQELLEMALEEEAEQEEYREQGYKEEAEAIEDIVEEETEDLAVDKILDDIWAEEILQEDAEDQLKWLLVEEEEKLERAAGEKEEEGKDPFLFEDLLWDWDLPVDSFSAEPDGEFSEGFESDYGAEYPMSSSEEEDYVGESLDDDEKEELMEEAAEILDLQDQEEEEEEERSKELEARRILESLVGTLTREAIQEELEGENDEEGEWEELSDDEADQEDAGDGNQSSSVLDAGMGDRDSEEIDKEEEEEVEKEVYNELLEFLENEINRAVDDVADDIMQSLNEEEGEEEGVVEAGETSDEGDYESLQGAASVQEEGQRVASEGSEAELDDGDLCPALQYFIDDCNIVNNYADLGADGYKELFAGACNRHQLCYACGEYYDVGTKLCDELYKAEMLARCEADDTDCKQRAKYFWLVARNNRIPDFESSPICGDSCILNFLVEV